MARFCVSAASALAVLLVVTMALVQGSMAMKYTVGDSTMWQLYPGHSPTFYQDWVASHKPFFSTDTLEFIWIDPDSVLLVSFDDFNTCNTANPIQKWPGNFGGSLTTMLFFLRDHPFQTLYFISGFEHNCASGQKFYIDVFQ